MYDSTLRDGTQSAGLTFTAADKIKIVKRLDEFGIAYIEAGNPASNPKDFELFKQISKMSLKNSKIVAFGSTRKAGIRIEDDKNVLSLAKADTQSVAIFGKSWDFHVTEVIRTQLEENLRMIFDTVSYFSKLGREVVYDAEHYFDGYKKNPEYALKTLQAAVDGGANWLVLCDTNGGVFPTEVANMVKCVRDKYPNIKIGIHCHNDSGMAVASSIMAVEQGASQVQGTVNGYGERCGNANLCSIIPNLQIKRGISCLPEDKIKDLYDVSRFLSETANLAHDESQPYVGNNAFSHKGGMHIDAIFKNPLSFEHVPPQTVGNDRRILMSEVSGRSTILKRIKKVYPEATKTSAITQKIIDRLKQLENQGYQFEGAESSFDLMVKRELGLNKKFFDVKHFKVFSEEHWQDDNSSTAMIKVKVDGVEEVTAAEGDGPINALDKALRKALSVFYPELNKMRLSDYKVRVLDNKNTTAAMVRVHIDSTDGEDLWGTVGVSTNIIEASWDALVDSIEYYLYKQE